MPAGEFVVMLEVKSPSSASLAVVMSLTVVFRQTFWFDAGEIVGAVFTPGHHVQPLPVWLH